MENTAPDTIKSISRAADILFCMGNGINTLTEIASYCGLPKSTAHRILKALIQSYLVFQDPVDQKYQLGPLVIRLSSNPQLTHSYLVSLSLDEMRRLWQAVEETVTLNTMIGIQFVRLHEIQSRQNLMVIDQYEPIGPVFIGATSRVLLSQLDDNELKTAMETVNIRKITNNSIFEKQEILDQVRLIQKQGYAISRGERIPGAFSISAPIHNYYRPAAMTVVGPESRFKSEQKKIIKELKDSTEHISNHLKRLRKQSDRLPSE